MTEMLERVGPSDVSREEWTIRCDLAALYRLVAHFRMTDLIYTHISARLPGPHHHFLINRYGVLFHEMRASDLIRVDLDGRVVQDGATDDDVNAAGFTIHSAIHRVRSDVLFIIHTHTAAGIAVSAQEDGLLPISQHALKFYGHLAYHTYEGVALDLDERERIVADLGPHKAMILRNHGLLVCGDSAADAFDQIMYLERACQAQVAALAGNRPLIVPPEAVKLKTAAQFRTADSNVEIHRAWLAGLRLIDGEVGGYAS